ncbi:unnamed protein product [Lymnaea stagnalis]|uniref:Uncharacterized protein n=1 Tax=Lymnaea stagnalis TaxID=6523 RepID=A0AAV2H2F3_LYMST
MSAAEHTIDVIILGEEGIGKTSLARTLTEGAFPVADSLFPLNVAFQVCCTNVETSLSAFDHVYHIRVHEPSDSASIKTTLNKAQCAYLCFDASCPATFNSVRQIWNRHVRNNKNNVILIIVGLKHDLACDAGTHQLLTSEGLQPITLEQGQMLSRDLKASGYVEVSSLRYMGIQTLKETTVFEFVANSNLKEKKRCTVM